MLKMKRFGKKPVQGKPKESEDYMPDNKDENTSVGNEEIAGGDHEVEEFDSKQIEIEAEPTGEESEMTDAADTDDDSEPDETGDDGSDESQKKLLALQSEVSESRDKYLRLAAEFDNYRKRTLREKSELIQTAGESLLIDILPVIDDFERGLEQASKTEDMDAVRTGMGLIYSKLKDFLTNNGVKEIEAIHEPFDTDWHEAVTNIPAPSDDMKGKIVDVIQKGYKLHEKVIRYPKVVVGE